MAGPKWEPLMRSLDAALRAEARSLGYTCTVINADAKSPFIAALESKSKGNSRDVAVETRRPKTPTEFWQKTLGKSAGHISTCSPVLAPDSFFDPRDFEMIASQNKRHIQNH